MDPATNPRGGFNFSLMLSIIAVAVGGVALYLQLTTDPLDARRGTNPLKGALDRYKEELKTPAGTAKAEIEMVMNRDFRANIEYSTIFEDKQLKEKFESFKVEKDADYKREPPKDPKAKKSKSTGEFKILFVTYKQDGEDKKETIVMEKFLIPTGEEGKDREMWRRAFMSSAEIGLTKKELADEMDKWK
jgi:hypothetical protein